MLSGTRRDLLLCGYCSSSQSPVMSVDELLIDFSDLLPGDILLFRSLHQTKAQKEISAATGSRYTHAAIYLGSNEIAEAAPTVRIRTLSDADKKGQVIGVLRSQTVFSQKRAAALRNFAEELIKQGVKYDFRGALTFEHRREVFVETLLQNLQENYGKMTKKDELLQGPYFCSALVVASYILSGVIGESAHLAYPPDVFSPAELHRDPTFGWFLGYVTNAPESIPSDDPLLALARWEDHQDMRWW
jgi:hypothetical protein